MEILHEKDGVDTELLVYAMTLINKVNLNEIWCLSWFIEFILKLFLLFDTRVIPFLSIVSFPFWQTLAALPDQDSFYDMVDGLEEQGMETVSQRHLGRKGTDLDLVEQLNIYEANIFNHRITRKMLQANFY